MIVNQEKLKMLLKKQSLTKSALCEKIGISSRTIAKIGKGEDIAERILKKIAEHLGCELKDLIQSNEILQTLRDEKAHGFKGGLYHETQIRLTYNSNHIEGSQLTEDQTRYIFETKTLGNLPSNVPIDDVIETNNHFRCIDFIIDFATEDLTEELILKLQALLKTGTKFADYYGAGKYKALPNTVGGVETCKPQEVQKEMKKLLNWYTTLKKVSYEDIVEFHYQFETIHPFQDGNGRIGRLIMFKECLRNDIVPFYIDDRYKSQYYNGLRQWKEEKGFLLETCRFGQDIYKQLLDYFEVKY